MHMDEITPPAGVEAPAAKPQGKRRRRGRGEGTISQLPTGVWRAGISAGVIEVDRGGTKYAKRNRRFVYGHSKAEVMEKLRELQDASHIGWTSEVKRLTVATFLNHWLDNTCAQVLRPNTLVQYRYFLEKYLYPYIGGSMLMRLNPMQIQGYLRELESAGVPLHTRRMVFSILRSAMNDAVALRVVVISPCSGISFKGAKSKAQEIWTPEQARRFLDTARKESPLQLWALFAVAIGTGMRKGELLGLRWEDVDFATGTVLVCRTLVESQGKLLGTNEPKTKSGLRRLTLTDEALDAIKALLKNGVSPEVPWVFATRVGTPYRQGNVSKELRRVAKIAGVPPMRFHGMRHLSATLMIQNGVDIKTASNRLGHSQPSITMNIYAHAFPQADANAAAKIGNALPRTPVEVEP